MSTSERTPLASDHKRYDSNTSPVLHEAEPTMVNSASGFSTSTTATAIGISRESTPRNWVPDPADEPGRPRTLVLCFDGTGDQFDDDVYHLSIYPRNTSVSDFSTL